MYHHVPSTSLGFPTPGTARLSDNKYHLYRTISDIRWYCKPWFGPKQQLSMETIRLRQLPSPCMSSSKINTSATGSYFDWLQQNKCWRTQSKLKTSKILKPIGDGLHHGQATYHKEQIILHSSWEEVKQFFIFWMDILICLLSRDSIRLDDIMLVLKTS